MELPRVADRGNQRGGGQRTNSLDRHQTTGSLVGACEFRDPLGVALSEYSRKNSATKTGLEPCLGRPLGASASLNQIQKVPIWKSRLKTVNSPKSSEEGKL
jgi:hypothetical protein